MTWLCSTARCRNQQVQVVYDAPQNIGTVRFQVYPTPNGGTTDMDATSLK